MRYTNRRPLPFYSWESGTESDYTWRRVWSVTAGAQIGTVLAMPISGLLCEFVSWDSVFYFFGQFNTGA